MTVVEGDLKAPFAIATTPRSRGGPNSFPYIALLYPWYVPYNAECLVKRYQTSFFESLVWLNLGLNLCLLGRWWIQNSPLKSYKINIFQNWQITWVKKKKGLVNAKQQKLPGKIIFLLVIQICQRNIWVAVQNVLLV